MSKSKNTFISDDVKNLFKSFGGNPEAYQEAPTVVGAVKPEVNASPQGSMQRDNIQAAPIQTKPAPTVQKSGGIFKPRKPQLPEVVKQALPVAEAEMVNDDDYMSRLAASPWICKHLMHGIANFESTPEAEQPSMSDAHVPVESHQTQQSVPVKPVTKVQIVVEPKPIAEIFNLDKMNSPLTIASDKDKGMAKKNHMDATEDRAHSKEVKSTLIGAEKLFRR